MPLIEVGQSVRLHYQDEGKGRPLVFIHGFGGGTEWWAPLVKTLVRRFRCVTLDLRGHGESDKPDVGYTIADMAKDVAALLEALDLRDVVLVGHSMGAAVAMRVVLNQRTARVTRLVSLAGTVPRATVTATEPWGMDQAMATGVVAGLRANYAATLQALTPALLFKPDEEIIDGLLASCLRVPPESAAVLMESAYAEDLRGHLGALKLPVLLLHSRQDQIGAPQWIEYAAARIPNCRTVWLEASGHYPMLEEPERVTRALAEFAGE
ncbi:MAG: alpha/beta hydrolase [Deltaproteobacteria bacterium]|nr:alpha/beta hydrolase [Deltaproteobacteria bacterium]